MSRTRAQMRRVRLGEITQESSKRIGANTHAPVLSSTKHHGLVRSDEYFKGRQIFSSDISGYKASSRGQIVYATNHLSEGSIGLQSEYDIAAVSPIYTVFSCSTQDVTPEYLIKVLKSQMLMDEYARHEQASVDRRGAIRYRDFATIEIPLPPIPEQDQIVQILDVLGDEITRTQEIIAKLESAREGLLRDLLAGSGLDREDWRSGPLSEWLTKLTVGVVNSATHAYVTDGIPFIRSQNVRPGRISTTGMLFVTPEFNRLHSKSAVQAGDVLVVRTGHPGTAAVVPPGLEGSNCFSLLVCRPRESALTADYLALYLNSSICKEAIGRLHFGSAQHNLNAGQIKHLPIIVPSVPMQKRIVDALNIQTSVVTAEVEKLNKLNLLRRGMTSDLLTGRVRVPTEVTG